jgi:glycosyltransferase involved in cell wall biosynthesis
MTVVAPARTEKRVLTDLRVAHVLPSFAASAGGPVTAVLEGSRALRPHGIQSVVFATDLADITSSQNRHRISRADLPDGADQVSLRLFPSCFPRRLATSPALYRALTRELRSYDLVHIHSLWLFPHFAAFRAARSNGVPHIVSPRGTFDPYFRERGRVRKWLAGVTWQDDLLRTATAVHFTSDEEARLGRDIAPERKRWIIPNGIDWANYQNLPAPGELWDFVSGDGPVLLSVSRLSHQKGLDVLIRAFGQVARSAPRACLVIAGPDTEGLKSKLTDLAARAGVLRRVVFTGRLSRAQMLEALGRADVWVSSSHAENFCTSLIEALAAGVPAVISRQVNIAGEIDAAGAGVVADLDASDFADKILALLSNEAEQALLSRRAREFAKSYDWSVVAPRMAEMYRAAAGSGTRAKSEDDPV